MGIITMDLLPSIRLCYLKASWRNKGGRFFGNPWSMVKALSKYKKRMLINSFRKNKRGNVASGRFAHWYEKEYLLVDMVQQLLSFLFCMLKSLVDSQATLFELP